jgi:hypothetical protein
MVDEKIKTIHIFIGKDSYESVDEIKSLFGLNWRDYLIFSGEMFKTKSLEEWKKILEKTSFSPKPQQQLEHANTALNEAEETLSQIKDETTLKCLRKIITALGWIYDGRRLESNKTRIETGGKCWIIETDQACRRLESNKTRIETGESLEEQKK